ncbi:hypothetical protein Tco_0515096 [Tanacetum coccineum]
MEFRDQRSWKLQLSIDICALTMLACNCKHGGVQEQVAPVVFASALLHAIFFLERNWISLCNDYKDTTLVNTKDEARLNPIHHHMLIIKATPLLRLLCVIIYSVHKAEVELESPCFEPMTSVFDEPNETNEYDLSREARPGILDLHRATSPYSSSRSELHDPMVD